jgi:hypothetical protein
LVKSKGKPDAGNPPVRFDEGEGASLPTLLPTLRGYHTQAKSLDALMKRVKEAIELCLEVEEPTPTEFVGVQSVAVNS